jgi:hypothetical protein
MSLPYPTLSTFTKPMPVALTDDEYMDRAKQLAACCQDIQAEEDRAKDIKEQLKARLSQLTSHRTDLSIAVSRREEMRPIEMVVLADYEAGEAITVRSDTVRVESRRPLTDAERQSHLPLLDESPELVNPDTGELNA